MSLINKYDVTHVVSTLQFFLEGDADRIHLRHSIVQPVIIIIKAVENTEQINRLLTIAGYKFISFWAGRYLSPPMYIADKN